jgi:hypothetical protein
MKKTLVDQYIELYRSENTEILDKYDNTETMQRLKGKGYFCGMDYVGIKKLKPKRKYTRYDHSNVVCHGTYSLTGDLKQALAGKFHDVGTRPFAHANSFKKGEGATQENDELDVKTILKNDKTILRYLKEDNIELEEVCDASMYPIVDKEIPALCMDRLDGILSTSLFWTGNIGIKDVTDLLRMITYFEQKDLWGCPSSERLENFEIEMGLNEMNSNKCYEDFFAVIGTYSRLLQSKESRYAMTLLGDILGIMETKGILSGNEQSEKEAIEKMLNSPYQQLWIDFNNLSEVWEVDAETEGYVINPKSKIRYTFPLVFDGTQPYDYFGICGDLYDDYIKLQPELDKVGIPLKGNLSPESEKILVKHKKESLN